MHWREWTQCCRVLAQSQQILSNKALRASRSTIWSVQYGEYRVKAWGRLCGIAKGARPALCMGRALQCSSHFALRWSIHRNTISGCEEYGIFSEARKESRSRMRA